MEGAKERDKANEIERLRWSARKRLIRQKMLSLAPE